MNATRLIATTLSGALLTVQPTQAQQVTGPIKHDLIPAPVRQQLFTCMMQPLPRASAPEAKAQQSLGRFFGVADAELNRFESSRAMFYQFYVTPANGAEATEAVPLRVGTAEPEVGFFNLESGQSFAFPPRVATRFRACDRQYKPR